MKRFNARLFLLGIFTVLLVSGSCWAQPADCCPEGFGPPPQMMGRQQMGGSPMGGFPMNGPGMMRGKADMGLFGGLKLIIDLDLSPDQVAKMVTLFKAHHTTSKAMNKQMKEQGKAFREAFDPDSFDAGKTRAFAAEQARLKQELMIGKYTFIANLYALLTPEQKTKVAPMLKRWKMGSRGKKMGGRNFMNPRNPMNRQMMRHQFQGKDGRTGGFFNKGWGFGPGNRNHPEKKPAPEHRSE